MSWRTVLIDLLDVADKYFVVAGIAFLLVYVVLAEADRVAKDPIEISQGQGLSAGDRRFGHFDHHFCPDAGYDPAGAGDPGTYAAVWTGCGTGLVLFFPGFPDHVRDARRLFLLDAPADPSPAAVSADPPGASQVGEPFTVGGVCFWADRGVPGVR